MLHVFYSLQINQHQKNRSVDEATTDWLTLHNMGLSLFLSIRLRESDTSQRWSEASLAYNPTPRASMKDGAVSCETSINTHKKVGSLMAKLGRNSRPVR